MRFADTMPMSTYLVAFVVGPLVATAPVDVDGKPLRVVCPVGKEHLADFALEVGEFALRFFTDWFGIVYPGDKLDLVAIPDFAFGAMENLGCVTFRERYLLVDPATATQAELQAVVDVIAHEIAHMWFGDLVTMKWWNGIWLNEAFATFMEMTCTDAFRPEWQRWVDFGLSRSAAFDTDALGRHPADRVPGGVARRRRRHVRRAHLREGRVGGAHARAVPGRRPLPVGHPPLHGPPPVRQHRDVRPVGRPRGRDRRARAAHRRVVDLPGRVPRGQRRARRRRDRAALRRSGGSATATATTATAAWAVPPGASGYRRPAPTPRASSAELLDGDGSARRSGARAATRRSRGSTPTSAPTASTGCATPPDLLDALLDHLGELTPLERYTLVDDAWASVLAGTVDAAVVRGDGRALRRRARPVGVGAHHRRAVDRSTAWSTATPATRCTRRVAALVGPGARRARAPTPARATTTAPARCAACSCRPPRCSATTCAAQERSAELLDQFLAHPPSVDPSLASPALVVSATLGDVALHERLVDRFQAPTTPRTASACCCRSPASGTPRRLQRTLDMALSGDVRTPGCARTCWGRR